MTLSLIDYCYEDPAGVRLIQLKTTLATFSANWHISDTALIRQSMLKVRCIRYVQVCLYLVVSLMLILTGGNYSRNGGSVRCDILLYN